MLRRYYGFGLWLPELFNRFENYHQSHPNASVTVCELIHNNRQSLNHTVPEEPFLLLANGVTTECKPHIDERVFINSLTINAICLFGNVASGYLANRVGRRTMPGTLLSLSLSHVVRIVSPGLSVPRFDNSRPKAWLVKLDFFSHNLSHKLPQQTIGCNLLHPNKCSWRSLSPSVIDVKRCQDRNVRLH